MTPALSGCVTLDELESAARSSWNMHPQLAHTFTDFGEFFQHFILSHSDHRGDPSLSIKDEYANLAVSALGRSDLGRRPMLSDYRSPVSERRGQRLILWLIGPITPFLDLAPAIDEGAVLTALEANLDADAIILRIDSPGGYAHIAERIYNRLLQHPARKIALIDHACLSSATYLLAAADRVLIRADASIMVHCAKLRSHGNADALYADSRWLKTHDDLFCRTLAVRRGIPVDQVRRLLPLERYLSASEAVEIGFADVVVPALPPLATPHTANNSTEEHHDF